MSELTHKALVAIQRDLKAPKSQENNFGGYKYRSAEDILNAVKPLLSEHGATLTLTDSIVEVGGRIYVCAQAVFAVDSTVSVDGFAREPRSRKGMDDSQITGAASSYARKYALNGLFAIDDTKDADATNDHGKGAPKATNNPAPKPKADPRALLAQRIEADKEAKWFEVVAWAKGDNAGKTLGEVAMEGDVASIKQLLDYIDPVALEHGEAVTRLKAAIAEAQSNADAGANKADDDGIPTDPKTGAKCPF